MAHVLLITTSYPQHQDGSEAAGAFVADFAATLAKYTHVTVLAPALEESSITVSERLRIKLFPVPRLPLSLLKPYNPLHWHAVIKSLRSGLIATKDAALDEQFSHILALWALPSGYWARRIAKNQGIDYSVWALGSDIWTLARIPLVRTILRKVLQSSRINFADGYQLANDVTRISSRHCHFLPSTRKLEVTENKSLATAPPYRLAFLGRWHRNKGIDLLLESLKQLCNEDWNRISEIRIAGGGPLAIEVQNIVNQLQGEGKPVTLLGYQDKHEAETLLSWADYLLLPSRIESIPVVFSDAMKCSTPVLCMPTGDLPALIEKHSVGIVARTISANDFTVVLQEALSTAPANYSDGLSKCTAEFDIDRIVKDFLHHIEIREQ